MLYSHTQTETSRVIKARESNAFLDVLFHAVGSPTNVRCIVDMCYTDRHRINPLSYVSKQFSGQRHLVRHIIYDTTSELTAAVIELYNYNYGSLNGAVEVLGVSKGAKGMCAAWSFYWQQWRSKVGADLCARIPKRPPLFPKQGSSGQ